MQRIPFKADHHNITQELLVYTEDLLASAQILLCFSCFHLPASVPEQAGLEHGCETKGGGCLADGGNGTVHGCTGATLQNGASASVVWLIGTPEKGTSFKLYSNSFTAEELLTIAESVQIQSHSDNS